MKTTKNTKTILKLLAFAATLAIAASCLVYVTMANQKEDQQGTTVLEKPTVSAAIEQLKAQESYEVPVEFDCQQAEYNSEGTIREKLDWLLPKSFKYIVEIYNEGSTTEETFKLQLRPLFWVEDGLNNGGLTEEEAYTLLVSFFYEMDSDGEDEEFREIIEKEAEVFLPVNGDKEKQERYDRLLSSLSNYLDKWG